MTFRQTLLELLTGEQTPGGARPELKIFKAMAKDFGGKLKGQGKAVVRKVTTVSNQAGLPPEYLPYVFFVLVEQVQNWPEMMPEQAKALRLGRLLMVEGSAVPNYRGQVQLPPSELEEAVGEILKRVGFWVQSKLSAELVGEYQKLLQQNMSKIKGILKDRVAPDKIPQVADGSFRLLVSEHPEWFTGGKRLQSTFDLIF